MLTCGTRTMAGAASQSHYTCAQINAQISSIAESGRGVRLSLRITSSLALRQGVAPSNATAIKIPGIGVDIDTFLSGAETTVGGILAKVTADVGQALGGFAAGQAIVARLRACAFDDGGNSSECGVPWTLVLDDPTGELQLLGCDRSTCVG